MLMITIIGHSTDAKYPVVELIDALEDVIDALAKMTTSLEADTPQPFTQVYSTTCGSLTVTLRNYHPLMRD